MDEVDTPRLRQPPVVEVDVSLRGGSGDMLLVASLLSGKCDNDVDEEILGCDIWRVEEAATSNSSMALGKLETDP